MQQELIRMVAERTGLSEDKARSAAETVIGYLKDKLPAPVSAQLDNITGGGSSGGGGSNGAGGGSGRATGGSCFVFNGQSFCE